MNIQTNQIVDMFHCEASCRTSLVYIDRMNLLTHLDMILPSKIDESTFELVNLPEHLTQLLWPLLADRLLLPSLDVELAKGMVSAYLSKMN